MKNLKNKVWLAKTKFLHALGRLNSKRRQRPDFLIVGAQKGGTSSLFYYLKFHPQVKRPIKKEIHFFNLFYQKGISWYLAHFPMRSNEFITGEATPAYMFHPDAAKRINELNPKIKLIALLREPVSRAYSAFQMNKRLGLEKRETFAEAIEYELEKLKADKEAYSYDRHNFYYLERGRYVYQLDNLLKHFNSKQLLLIKSEAFFADPKSTLTRVYDFLGITKTYPESYKVMNIGKYPSLNEDIYNKIVHYFKEDLQTLKANWGIDLVE